MKDGVVFRTKDQPHLSLEDWEKFNSVNRHDAKEKRKSDLNVNWHEPEDDELDTTIIPFYMYRWPLVHENKHTARLSRVS